MKKFLFFGIFLVLLISIFFIFFISAEKLPAEIKSKKPAEEKEINTDYSTSELKGKQLTGRVDRSLVGNAVLLKIVVLNEKDSTPIQDVEILSSTAEKIQFQGKTNSSGILETALPDISSLDLIVKSEGFAKRVVSINKPFPQEATIRLRKGGNIQGKVVLENGDSAGAGVKVLAWRWSRYPKLQNMMRIQEGDVSLNYAVTNPEGIFKIDSLDLLSSYSIVAGNESSCSGTLRGVIPDQSPIVLKLFSVYMVGIRLRDHDEPLHVSPELYCDSFLQWHCEGVEYISEKSLPTILNGFDPLTMDREGPHTKILVFYSSKSESEIDPVTFRISVPGYERQEVKIKPKLVARGVTFEDVSMKKVPNEEFGNLEIELKQSFIDALSNLSQKKEGAPFVVVHLFAETGEHFLYAVRNLENTQNIVGVPYGKYDLAVSTQLQFSNNEPPTPVQSSIVIGANPAKIFVDLSAFGAIVCKPLDEEGFAFSSAGEVQCISEGQLPETKFSLFFSKAPYVITNVPPGKYRLSFHPFSEAVVDSNRRYFETIHVQVSEASVSDVSFVVPK